MIKVRGVYDGQSVRLLEDVDIPPDTEVEVLVPDAVAEGEAAYWQRLRELGLVTIRGDTSQLDPDFEPIPNPGEPISDTIIRDRR